MVKDTHNVVDGSQIPDLEEASLLSFFNLRRLLFCIVATVGLLFRSINVISRNCQYRDGQVPIRVNSAFCEEEALMRQEWGARKCRLFAPDFGGMVNKKLLLSDSVAPKCCHSQSITSSVPSSQSHNDLTGFSSSGSSACLGTCCTSQLFANWHFSPDGSFSLNFSPISNAFASQNHCRSDIGYYCSPQIQSDIFKAPCSSTV